MIRPTLLTLAAASLLAGPVLAETPAPRVASSPGVPEVAFSNTLLSVYPDGRTAKLWLERDGTYRGEGRRGKPTSGRWTAKGGEVCFKQRRPFPSPMSYCAPLKSGGVGTEWAAKAVTGEPITVRLVAGR